MKLLQAWHSVHAGYDKTSIVPFHVGQKFTYTTVIFPSWGTLTASYLVMQFLQAYYNDHKSYEKPSIAAFVEGKILRLS